MNLPYNKRMQPDRSTRYASETAADARRYIDNDMIKKISSYGFLFFLILINPSVALAAGVDFILLIPAGWFLAILALIASAKLAPKKRLFDILHTCNIIFYGAVIAVLSAYQKDTFFFLVLYPIISTSILLFIAWVMRIASTSNLDNGQNDVSKLKHEKEEST